jgi:hypothetical protein
VLLTREPKHFEKKNNAANDRGPNAACGSSTDLHHAVIRVYDDTGNVIETHERLKEQQGKQENSTETKK